MCYIWLGFLITNYILCNQVYCLIIEGTLKTKEDWQFIARFCYQSVSGKVEYFFEYPNKFCCQDAILYYDTQWPLVYPQEVMSCRAKVEKTNPDNNQILKLSQYTVGSGCKKQDNGNGQEVISCSGSREFTSFRARWWYLVISKCGSLQGLELKYRMVMTNGDTFWTKHFSADEKNILQVDIFFLIMYTMVIILSLYVAYLLSNRQLFHTTYKLYMWTVLFEFLSIGINIIYYTDYGVTGKPMLGVKNLGRACHCISDIIFVVLLIVLGKGWTITRGRISAAGQVKLSAFCTIYGIAYVALFIYEAKAFNPGKVLYVYASPAGWGICALRVIAWVWFCYGVFFTIKHYVDKRTFYSRFWLFYSIWYLSGPVAVMIGNYALEPYMRAQTMNGVDRTVAMFSAVFFLIITRPSAANANFPYHVRTSQIGIIDDTDSSNSFEQRAYVPSTNGIELTSRENRANMFSVVNNQSHTMNGRASHFSNGQHGMNNNSNLGIQNNGFNDGMIKTNRNFVHSNGQVYSTPAVTSLFQASSASESNSSIFTDLQQNLKIDSPHEEVFSPAVPQTRSTLPPISNINLPPLSHLGVSLTQSASLHANSSDVLPSVRTPGNVLPPIRGTTSHKGEFSREEFDK